MNQSVIFFLPRLRNHCCAPFGLFTLMFHVTDIKHAKKEWISQKYVIGPISLALPLSSISFIQYLTSSKNLAFNNG